MKEIHKPNIKQFILEYSACHGKITIPQMIELTGLSSTSIANCINAAVSEGLMEATDESSAEPAKGRKAKYYMLKGDSAYFVGVDVKYHELNIGIMDFSGKFVKKTHDPSFRLENTFECLDEVCNKVLKTICEDPIYSNKIKFMCFSLSGRVDSSRGTSASIFNFEDFQYTSLSSALSEKLGVRVIVENDTKTMAFGEYESYYEGKCKNLLFVNMSWGIGLGLVLNGELFSGSDGYSGEIGHVRTYDNNILCHCGKKGCVETEVSMRAICRKITERIHQNGESSLLFSKVNRGIPLTPEDIIEAAKREDPLCIDVLASTATELGHHLAGMLNIFNPEVIVIGGKISRIASYYFFQQVAVSIRQNSLKLMCQNVSIKQSELKDDASVIGACMLTRKKFISEK